MRTRFLFLLPIALWAFACHNTRPVSAVSAPAATGTQVLRTPDWAKNAVIYEVNIRQFSKEGTF